MEKKEPTDLAAWLGAKAKSLLPYIQKGHESRLVVLCSHPGSFFRKLTHLQSIKQHMCKRLIPTTTDDEGTDSFPKRDDIILDTQHCFSFVQWKVEPEGKA